MEEGNPSNLCKIKNQTILDFKDKGVKDLLQTKLFLKLHFASRLFSPSNMLGLPHITPKRQSMKTASTELFDLINSLTVNEKAYFKRYAGMHKAADSGYLKLFEVIAVQSIYCEEKVKSLLKNEKLVDYFPRAKKYLYDKILEGMRLYNADKNLEARLWRKYEDAYFLYSRKQLKPALKLVKKILKQAEDAECWLLHIKIFDLYTLLTYQSVDIEKEIENWLEVLDLKISQAKDKHHFRLINLSTEGLWLAKSPNPRRTSLKAVKDTYLQRNEQDLEPLTVEGAICFNRVYGIYHKAFKEFDLFYEKTKRIVHLYESNPPILEKKFSSYYYTLQTLITADIDRFDQQKASQHIEKLENYFFAKKSPLLKDEYRKIDILPHFYFTQLVYFFKFGLHEKGLKTVKESQKILKKYPQTSIYNVLMLQNMHYLFYLIHEQWGKALDMIQQILDTPQKPHKYVYISALYWQLFIHLQLSNDEHLEYLLRNTIRAWKQENVFTPRFQELCKLIQRQINTLYPEFWSEVAAWAYEDGKATQYQGVDTLYAFAESRRQRRSMEVVRRELIEAYAKRKKASIEG